MILTVATYTFKYLMGVVLKNILCCPKHRLITWLVCDSTSHTKARNSYVFIVFCGN